ncbi:MAG: ATP-binding protein [Dysgonamonadaceae bacterium]|jgi:predicted AAA+ superfamily ATPase|nr:ATP-binding protein [Dysgonamonadaceae bacterium]
MKRKIYNELLSWKQERAGKVAIMIDGARRIGKSYIVEEFARHEYKSYILVDFNRMENNLLDIFESYLTNLDMFFNYLSLFFNVTLYERDSVIVFDEVQLYPKARAAIKYLVADGRYDYIETGSLVSINRNVKDIVIPSEEHRIDMYPMDFEEFLWAIGEEQLAPFIRQCYEKRLPAGPLHQKIMQHFRHYLIIGGMPQAVLTYIETGNFLKTDTVKRDILKLYKADIEKYAEGNETKVKAIFDEIPSALGRHEKKFHLATLKDTARYRDYESAFFWLSESRVVNICYNSTAPNIGLRLNEERTTLKCYMADTGLLISHAFSEKTVKSEDLYLKLALGKLELNEGMIIENVVAQMIRAAGYDLYFFSKYSKEVADDRMEIDFLLAKPVISNRHNISPVEVKSGSGYSLSSLTKLRKKYSSALAESYVLHTADVKMENEIVYLPLYMAGLL